MIKKSFKTSKINSHGTHFRSCTSTAIKVQGKVVSVDAMKAHSGNRGTAPLIVNLGKKIGSSGQLQMPPLLSSGQKPRYPLIGGRVGSRAILTVRRQSCRSLRPRSMFGKQELYGQCNVAIFKQYLKLLKC